MEMLSLFNLAIVALVIIIIVSLIMLFLQRGVYKNLGKPRCKTHKKIFFFTCVMLVLYPIIFGSILIIAILSGCGFENLFAYKGIGSTATIIFIVSWFVFTWLIDKKEEK